MQCDLGNNQVLKNVQLSQKADADADVEVSWADQQKINQFSKLNAKIDDLEERYEKLKVMLHCVTYP